MTPGRLILVSGYAGAGKTTLIRAALRQLPGLEYLRTTVTRPMRPDEQDSSEYEFVSVDEYDRRRRCSRLWDHSEYDDHYYGADIEAARRLLHQGVPLICGVIPDGTYQQMGERYGLKPVLIWVDTPLETANRRLLATGDVRRARRIHHSLQQPAAGDTIRRSSQYIFTPTGNVADDERLFTDLLADIINNV